MSPAQILTAFLAGLGSFFSPCVLPLIPGYISLMSGLSAAELLETSEGTRVSRKTGMCSLAFVAGFSLTFSAMGATASSLGGFLADQRETVAKVSGILLVILGLHILGVFNFRFLNYERRFSMNRLPPGMTGAFLMGLAFAAGWSPCVGPFLAGVLTMAASNRSSLEGALLLFAYSLGLGIPFILAGFATGKFFASIANHRKTLRYMELAAGVVLIMAGIFIFQNRLMSFRF
ncbi:MAG: cytochrome c biogenesis protein CcdA [bacterium]